MNKKLLIKDGRHVLEHSVIDRYTGKQGVVYLNKDGKIDTSLLPNVYIEGSDGAKDFTVAINELTAMIKNHIDRIDIHLDKQDVLNIITKYMFTNTLLDYYTLTTGEELTLT